LFDAFMNVVDGLADIPTVLLVLFYSAYLWIVIALTFVFSFLALDTHVPLVAASLTMVVTVAAAVSLPQAPGAAGTWQFACVFPLERLLPRAAQARGRILDPHLARADGGEHRRRGVLPRARASLVPRPRAPGARPRRRRRGRKASALDGSASSSR
jgi:hypothetical protein